MTNKGAYSVFLGLRTIIYPTSDLEQDTAWWSHILGFEPYFKEPFYVGFNVGGYELGLHPGADASLGQQTYFGVENIDEAVALLTANDCTITEAPTDKGGGIITASLQRSDGQFVNIIYNPYIVPDQPLRHIDDPEKS